MVGVQEYLEQARDTTVGRTLKTKDAHFDDVKEAISNRFDKVRKEHETDLIQSFKEANPKYKNWDMETEIIHHQKSLTEQLATPKTEAKIEEGVNVDVDYRLKYKKNEKGPWLEVPKEKWQRLSEESFAKVTSYEPKQFREALSTADKARFDQMSNSEQLAFYHEKSNWKATDKFQIEASRDNSDQYVDLKTGKKQQLPKDEINIVNVKKGYAKLKDAEAHGEMYHAKVKDEINAGNKSDAFVQAKKAVVECEQVREGYGKQNIKYGKLDPKLKEGMKLIKDNAEVIGRGDTKTMAVVEKGLNLLGFKGLEDFSSKVSSQIGALKWLK